MIKRINTLKRTGRFTELNSHRGSEGDFSKLNVIYANNACGKSTLCDVLRSMDTGNPAYVLGRKNLNATADPEIVVSLEGGAASQTVRFQDGAWQNRDVCPPIHIYDDRFVAENVFIGHHISVDQRRNLYGLVIGDQAIALKQAVDTAEQCLNAATTEFNTARDNLSRLLPEGYSIETFRNLPAVDDVDQQIEVATDKLTSAKQTKAKAEAIHRRKPLSPLRIAKVPDDLESVLSTTLDSVALVAEKKIRDHLAATSHGLSIEWVQQGHRAQKGTLCPHCGQDMQGLEILEAYRAFFSGELQNQENLRESLKTAVDAAFGETAQNQLRETIIAHETERTWWQDAAGYTFSLPPLRNHESILHALQVAHRAMSDALARKQGSPGISVELTPDEAQAIANWKLIAAELVTYNENLSTINQELDQRKASAGTIDLTPLQQRLASLIASKKRYEQAVIDAFAAYDSAELEKTKSQRAKQNANEALREQSNQLFAHYGVRINELLELFAVDFRIVSDGVNFRGGQPSGQLAIELFGTRVSSAPEAASDPSQPSLANTLSGGDRSALALAYFLARLELDPDIGNCIVVFDDPYHNQDRSRRQCTIERIHHIVDISRQCFVLSHDLEFARAVEKRLGTPAKTFILKPLANPAILEATALPLLPSQAYEKNYHRLCSFVENPANHLEHLKEIADTLRVILEEYFRLKFPTSWEDKDWLGDIIRKVREAEESSPLYHCQSLVEELSHINTYCQRFHHGSSGEQADEPDPRELKIYAERTLKVIHSGGNV